jgi:hypothetical protein
MRTGQFATAAIAVGMLGLLLLSSVPSASACSITSGTSCIVSIYYHERQSVMNTVGGAGGVVAGKLEEAGAAVEGAQGEAEGRAAAAGGWAGAFSEAAAGCSSLPGLPQVPGVPGIVDWDPQPAIDSNLDYAADQQSVVATFGAESGGNPFDASADVITNGYANTEAVFQRWDEHVFGPLVFDGIGNVTSPEVPEAPDLEAFLAEIGTLDAGAQVESAQQRADCAAHAPLPPL